MVSVSLLGPGGPSSPLFLLDPHLARRRVALEISQEGASRVEGTVFLLKTKRIYVLSSSSKYHFLYPTTSRIFPESQA